jgi:hypothetical protein
MRHALHRYGILIAQAPEKNSQALSDQTRKSFGSFHQHDLSVSLFNSCSINAVEAGSRLEQGSSGNACGFNSRRPWLRLNAAVILVIPAASIIICYSNNKGFL